MEKIDCKKCGEKILISTYKETKGSCMPCFKKRPFALFLSGLTFLLLLLLYPFILFFSILYLFYHFLFLLIPKPPPHYYPQIETSVQKYIVNEEEQAHYLSGFLDGHDCSINNGISLLRSFSDASNHPLYNDGFEDAIQLRLNYCKIEELPSRFIPSDNQDCKPHSSNNPHG